MTLAGWVASCARLLLETGDDNGVCGVQAKTQGLTFYSSQHADELRPLVQTIWEFLLPTLSTTFSEAGSDQLLWQECLQGLVEAACLTCSLGLAFIASTFVRTLANFTSLHEPQSMRMQHAAALRHLLHIPDRVGARPGFATARCARKPRRRLLSAWPVQARICTRTGWSSCGASRAGRS